MTPLRTRLAIALIWALMFVLLAWTTDACNSRACDWLRHTLEARQ